MRGWIRLAPLVAASVICAGAEVQSVYVLPMAGGLDQYVASRLTQESVFRVVTDPRTADAVLTDSLGEAFEKRLAELLAPEDEEKSDKQGGDERVVRPFSGSRGKGTVFLVDTKTRSVIWSAYERPRNPTPNEMNHTASRLVERLRKAFKAAK